MLVAHGARDDPRSFSECGKSTSICVSSSNDGDDAFSLVERAVITADIHALVPINVL